MGNNSVDLFLEAEWVQISYQIVRMLCDEKLISRNPENVRIIRRDRKEIYPCRRSFGPEVLDTSQLKWAAREGRFWFLGPIKSLMIILDEGPIQGKLEVKPTIFEKPAKVPCLELIFKPSNKSRTLKTIEQYPISRDNIREFLKIIK